MPPIAGLVSLKTFIPVNSRPFYRKRQLCEAFSGHSHKNSIIKTSLASRLTREPCRRRLGCGGGGLQGEQLRLLQTRLPLTRTAITIFSLLTDVARPQCSSPTPPFLDGSPLYVASPSSSLLVPFIPLVFTSRVALICICPTLHAPGNIRGIRFNLPPSGEWPAPGNAKDGQEAPESNAN